MFLLLLLLLLLQLFWLLMPVYQYVATSRLVWTRPNNADNLTVGPRKVMESFYRVANTHGDLLKQKEVFKLHKKRIQLSGDWFGTPTWPPLRLRWCHVMTLYWQHKFVFVFFQNARKGNVVCDWLRMCAIGWNNDLARRVFYCTQPGTSRVSLNITRALCSKKIVCFVKQLTRNS